MAKGKKKGGKAANTTAAGAKKEPKNKKGIDPNLPVPTKEANPAAGLIFVGVIMGLILAMIAVQFLTK